MASQRFAPLGASAWIAAVDGLFAQDLNVGLALGSAQVQVVEALGRQLLREVEGQRLPCGRDRALALAQDRAQRGDQRVTELTLEGGRQLDGHAAIRRRIGVELHLGAIDRQLGRRNGRQRAASGARRR
ncbi:hypothetical protein MUN86_28050 (plasmid) [Hymenobacter volaticus]|uniref:DUF222 domain-containing protein n=1 Tax=Hymenobacter volaticus TaxID=2932254 RepID=A0ABY4GF38_9BACT|nr:hypothetical protein [Hymenobacter volaticus]UOQ69498.1 hypothetical protein MUN86_28050 [Hymenobacter volaticus]